MRIEVQVKYDTEAPTQRSGDQTGASCGPNQSKFRQFEFDRTSTSSLTNQQIELVILHRRIKFFFKCRQQTMNLVDEKYIAFLKICQQVRRCRPLSRSPDRRWNEVQRPSR